MKFTTKSVELTDMVGKSIFEIATAAVEKANELFEQEGVIVEVTFEMAWSTTERPRRYSPTYYSDITQLVARIEREKPSIITSGWRNGDDPLLMKDFMRVQREHLKRPVWSDFDDRFEGPIAPIDSDRKPVVDSLMRPLNENIVDKKSYGAPIETVRMPDTDDGPRFGYPPIPRFDD